MVLAAESGQPTTQPTVEQGHTASPLPARNTEWAAGPLAQRLSVLGRARHLFAARQDLLLEAMPPHLSRTPADTLAAELLPLLAACKFLEEEAPSIIGTRVVSGRRPFWLAGIESSVERVALGTVLLIGPANYPLFLPGVQALQALVAGNAVIWKPGHGGAAVAHVFRQILVDAGLPTHLLEVTSESVEAAEQALDLGVDHVVFTGSSAAGKQVMARAARKATSVIAELSGCDAVFVSPGAEVARVVDALAFGMRLNGSATCMAPRRLMLIGSGHEALLQNLRDRFATMATVPVSTDTLAGLRELVEDAAASGATVVGELRTNHLSPVLILNASASMRVTQADIFAPVLSVLSFADEAEALAADGLCPCGLTAAVFGREREAKQFGAKLKVGTVLINDLIVPTADPRVPFGGRRASGFGVTRGAEGLLAMTAPRTLLIRRGRDRRHLQPTGDAHRQLFSGVLATTHAQGWRARFNGILQVMQAVRILGSPSTSKNGSSS